MAFWPDVNRGDRVQHHMLLENDLRHMVNAQNGFSSRPNGRTLGSVVRVRIWNASTAAIVSGAPVMFDNTKDLCNDAFPAIPCTDSSRFWGVCENDLAVGEIGECVISGAVGVTFSSGTVGNYAAPDATGTAFVRGDVGVPIMFQNTVMGGVVCLGATASDLVFLHAPFQLSFNGGTAGTTIVDIAPGFASRNGTAVWVSSGTVGVSESGYVMLRAPFIDGTGWGDFELAVIPVSGGSVAITDADYPLGWVTINGGTITSVESFNPPMAVFIKAGTCS